MRDIVYYVDDISEDGVCAVTAFRVTYNTHYAPWYEMTRKIEPYQEGLFILSPPVVSHKCFLTSDSDIHRAIVGCKRIWLK